MLAKLVHKSKWKYQLFASLTVYGSPSCFRSDQHVLGCTFLLHRNIPGLLTFSLTSTSRWWDNMDEPFTSCLIVVDVSDFVVAMGLCPFPRSQQYFSHKNSEQTRIWDKSIWTKSSDCTGAGSGQELSGLTAVEWHSVVFVYACGWFSLLLAENGNQVTNWVGSSMIRSAGQGNRTTGKLTSRPL